MPTKKNQSDYRRVTAALPIDLYERLKKQAEKDYRTINSEFNKLIRISLEQQEQAQSKQSA